jgi:hypothetical protein
MVNWDFQTLPDEIKAAIIANGDDGKAGFTPDSAVQDIHLAHDMATANQNDTIVLIGTTNAATPTTARVESGGLPWNKDNVHLLGVCSGNHAQQRARISPATTDTATVTPFDITADNCRFENFSVFHGVDGYVGGSVAAKAVRVRGQRNAFKNVTMSGLGDSTGANSMDEDGACSLSLEESENLFENCYIGLETVGLGANGATAIQISGAVSRNLFRGGIIAARATSTEFRLIEAAASALQDMGAYFDGVLFTNSGIFVGGASAEGVFEINATQNGGILLNGGTCGAIGFDFWEEDVVSGKLYIANPAVGAGLAGLGTVAVGA